MRVTVDKRGRIVIPQALRVALGIGPDTEMELMPDGNGLRLEPVRQRQRTIDEAPDGLPLLGRVEGTVITDDDVFALIDASRR